MKHGERADLSRFTSLAAAITTSLAILLLLAVANRQTERPPQPDLGTPVALQSVTLPANETQAVQSREGPADLSSLLPAIAPVVPVRLAIEPQAPEIQVSLAQMLQKRYSHRDLARFRSHAGGFGVSSLFDVDEPVQSVFIPPNHFPDNLLAAGVIEGSVYVVIMIDERGRASVRRVLGASHPELVAPVVDSINRAVYSVPVQNGRPTKVLITRQVVFRAGEQSLLLVEPPEAAP